MTGPHVLVPHFVAGVSRKLDGGAGAHCGAASPLPWEWCEALPITRICPMLFIACASTNTTPRVTEAALFRSLMPPCFVHIKARSPDELVELPTTAPLSLIPSARLEFPPGSTPRSCIPVA